MLVLILIALATVITGVYAMSIPVMGRAHMWVTVLHTLGGLLLIVLAIYSILYSRRLP